MVFTRNLNFSKHSLGSIAGIKSKAKELRKYPTASETKLWKYLRKEQLDGMQFRRQHPYGIYILDFFCFKANLAIEVDGAIHLQQKEYDQERSRFIESTGVKVIRFRNEEIENSIEQVIERIREAVKQN